MLCPVDTGAKSLKLGQDRDGGGGPDERFAGLVVVGHEVIDLGDRIHAPNGTSRAGRSCR
jgi:hypothetical protein